MAQENSQQQFCGPKSQSKHKHPMYSVKSKDSLSIAALHFDFFLNKSDGANCFINDNDVECLRIKCLFAEINTCNVIN